MDRIAFDAKIKAVVLVLCVVYMGLCIWANLFKGIKIDLTPRIVTGKRL